MPRKVVETFDLNIILWLFYDSTVLPLGGLQKGQNLLCPVNFQTHSEIYINEPSVRHSIIGGNIRPNGQLKATLVPSQRSLPKHFNYDSDGARNCSLKYLRYRTHVETRGSTYDLIVWFKMICGPNS